MDVRESKHPHADVIVRFTPDHMHLIRTIAVENIAEAQIQGIKPAETDTYWFDKVNEAQTAIDFGATPLQQFVGKLIKYADESDAAAEREAFYAPDGMYDASRAMRLERGKAAQSLASLLEGARKTANKISTDKQAKRMLGDISF